MIAVVIGYDSIRKHLAECVMNTRGIREKYRENEELDGYDPYSNSKSCSELVTHSYKNSFFNDDHVAISTARAGNVIGGGDFANDRIIPDCIRAAIKHTELLKAEDQFVTYIPEGFAHGFISLTNDTIFSYQCSGRYVPSACGGIRWNDPELNIPWPLKEYGVEHIIATEKDKNWPTLAEYIELRK